jgi:hypothetical protein
MVADWTIELLVSVGMRQSCQKHHLRHLTGKSAEHAMIGRIELHGGDEPGARCQEGKVHDWKQPQGGGQVYGTSGFLG